jgi:predicted transcriptional regulator
MAREKAGQLTPAEWKIMRIAWRLKKFAARDVYKETERLFGWAPTTTKTVLTRLVGKSYLTTSQVGNSFLYRPSRSALRTLLDAADALMEQLLEGTSGPVLAHLVKHSSLTPEELADLKALIVSQEAQASSVKRPTTERKGE